MRKDIDFPEVSHVGVCAIPEEKEGMQVWVVYILNLLPHSLSNVLVSTKGYGLKGDEEVKTSELRHFFELIGPREAKQVEIIPQDLKGLTNQFWVSFYADGKLFDKKFIFLPDSLVKEHYIEVPVLKKRGVLII